MSYCIQVFSDQDSGFGIFVRRRVSIPDGWVSRPIHLSSFTEGLIIFLKIPRPVVSPLIKGGRGDQFAVPPGLRTRRLDC